MKTIEPVRAKWAGTLTDRERFNNQMHYRPVDRSFNMEFGYWNENFHQWPIFRDNGISNNREADRFFNFDRIEILNGPIWMHPTFAEEKVDETENTIILRNIDGLLAEVPKDGHDTIPHYLQSSITTPDDWARCKAERFRLDDPQRTVDLDAIRLQHPSDRDYPLGVWCGSMIGRIRDMLTFEGLAYACHDYPEMVEDMVETACQLVEKFLDQVLGCIDFDYAAGWEDICYKNGPLVSLGFFNSVVVPRYQRISRKLQQAGITLWYIDCDGDIRHILPGFLEGGVNCMFPLEVNGSGHPGPILEEFGPQLRIMGGVDKVALGRGREAIRAYLETLVPLVERGGYIPFCDHRCPPNVKQEDYLYYLDLKEELYGRP